MSEIIDDFKSTWLKIMKTPAEFFEQMPTEGGYADPVKFAVISYLIAGIGMTLISLGMGFALIIVMPIMGVIGIFTTGLFLHIFFKIVGGKGTYEGTVRLLAYASATVALSWIPLVNIIIPFYMVYIEMIGGAEVHKISTVSSMKAVLVIPLIIAIVLILAIAGIVATMGGMY